MGRDHSSAFEFTQIDGSWWIGVMNGQLWRINVTALPGASRLSDGAGAMFKSKFKYLATRLYLQSYVRLEKQKDDEGTVTVYAYVQTKQEGDFPFRQDAQYQARWRPAPPVILRSEENRYRKTPWPLIPD